MLHLEIIDKKVCKDYADDIIPGLIKRIRSGRTHNGKKYKLSMMAKAILLPKWNTKHPDDHILRDLLTGAPQDILRLSKDLEAKLFALNKRSRPTKKALEEIFHYDGVLVKDKERGYGLAKLIGRNTCTYCNRQYVFTIEHEKENGEIRHIARPVFDHWFAKSEYPLLSLSIHNLIPSCTTCNSSVKGTIPMHPDKHIHPYDPVSKDSQFTFRATKKPSEKSEWTLVIDRKPDSKIDQTINDLALEEVYAFHAGLEVKDIMDFNEAYSQDYITGILNNMFAENIKGLTKKDVYRILFGVEYDTERFLDRPFSKLKHDILHQIGVISDKEEH